jgi:serine/threonine protein phosphatase PrpC
MSSHHQQSSSTSSIAGVSTLLAVDPRDAMRNTDVSSAGTATLKEETAVAVGGLGPNVLKATERARYKHHQAVLPANNLQFGFSSVQGLRDHMEDAVVIASTLAGDLAECSYVAILDGHGGYYASDWASKHLLPVLLQDPRLEEALRNPVPPRNAAVFKEGFISSDSLLRKKLNAKGLEGRQGVRRAGTTAATAFITPKHIIMINAGDSRAVLIRNNAAYQVNIEHSPLMPAERERVEHAGSFVSDRGRIHDNLNVSRGIGDHGHKDNPDLPLAAQAVSPEPDVHVITRKGAEDQFLIVGSDGLYEPLGNKDVGVFVLQSWKDTHGDIQKVAEGLVDYSLEAGSRDNVTAIVVAFNEGASRLIGGGGSGSSSSSSSAPLAAGTSVRMVGGAEGGAGGGSSSSSSSAKQPHHHQHHPHPEDESGAYYRGERGDPRMR